MAQQPNIANFNAAIAGLSQATSNIAQNVQDYNAHQQALNNELLMFGNAPIAQIQQQLANILAAINQGNLLNSARDWNINAKMDNSKVYEADASFVVLRSVNTAPNSPTALNQPIPGFPDTPTNLDQLSVPQCRQILIALDKPLPIQKNTRAFRLAVRHAIGLSAV